MEDLLITNEAQWSVSRYEEAFLQALGGCLNLNDFTEYSARRHDGGTCVLGRSRLYAGEKIDRVIVTEYLLKRGQRGVVIFGYPKVEYEIPSFIFYLGGKRPTRTLMMLDLVPPSTRTDMSAFRRLSESARASMELSQTGADFLRSVSSPYLLHCAFKPADPEDLLRTMKETANIWRSVHIEPAEPDETKAHIRQRTRSLLKLKETLHRSSPAIGVFTRAFGKEMSDVFARAEYGGRPCAAIDQTVETPSCDTWANKRLGIIWTADAQELVLEAPLFLRGLIRRRIEQEAVAKKLTAVTVDLVEECERKYRRG